MLLGQKNGKFFQTLNMLSVVMSVVLLALFAFKYYSRSTVVSETTLISSGIGNSTQMVAHMADIAYITRRLEVLSSGGVIGDLRSLASVTDLKVEDAFKKFQELSKIIYMLNFDFEGSFFGLGLDKSRLKSKTKGNYKNEGGYKGVKETNLDELTAQFLSGLFSLEIVDISTMARATETDSYANMARRGIFFIT